MLRLPSWGPPWVSSETWVEDESRRRGRVSVLRVLIAMQLKPHGAIYGQTARTIDLARAVVGVAKTFNVAFMGLAGTCHQTAASELGVPFIAGKSLSRQKVISLF